MAAPDDAVTAADDTAAVSAAAGLPAEPGTGLAPAAPLPSGWPRSFHRAPDGTVRRNLPPSELRRVVAAGQGTTWVGIDPSVRQQVALLEPVFGMHPLAVEDVLNPETRVKIDEYGEAVFIVIRAVAFCDSTDDPYDTETQTLCFFLRPGLLVTAHAEQAQAIAAMVDRIERSPDTLDRGPVFLMHQIMDAAVDAFFPIVDRIDDFADGLEQRVFVSFDQQAMREIFSVKRLVVSLRRQLAPQRDVFNALANRPIPAVPAAAQKYFRDVYDHVMRINESLEAQRDILGSTLDAYLTQVSNRLGQTSKGLAVIATLSIPFVMISGMWGMNFERIPLSHHPHGFAIMVVVQLAIGLALIWILRRLKLL